MEVKQYGNVARACARRHDEILKNTLLAIFPKPLKGVSVKGAINGLFPTLCMKGLGAYGTRGR